MIPLRGIVGNIYPVELNMTTIMPFGEVLEAADQLSSDEQQALIAILHRRLSHAGRQQLVTDVEETRKEFAEGKRRPVTPDDLMREILG